MEYLKERILGHLQTHKALKKQELWRLIGNARGYEIGFALSEMAHDKIMADFQDPETGAIYYFYIPIDFDDFIDRLRHFRETHNLKFDQFPRKIGIKFIETLADATPLRKDMRWLNELR